MSEAFKDELMSQMCWRHVTWKALSVERLCLLLSTPETFLPYSHALRAAGQQAVSSSAAGVMEH